MAESRKVTQETEGASRGDGGKLESHGATEATCGKCRREVSRGKAGERKERGNCPLHLATVTGALG